MTPCQIIRTASLTEIALNLRGGRLYASLPADPLAGLVATITAHKPAIIAVLHEFAACPALREMIFTRPDLPALDDAGRAEAEALAVELAQTGGLGQFVCDLFHTWNDLTAADRAAACHAWRLAAMSGTGEHAVVSDPLERAA